MKKTLTICLFLLLCLTSIQAQKNDSDKKIKHEFGLDITDLMRQFLFSSSGFFPAVESSTESYTLSYRLMYKDKVNLRLGIGGNFRTGEESLDTLNFNLDRTGIRYRIGIDRIQRISKRWEAYYGIDFFQERTEAHNSFTSTSNNYVRSRVTTGNRYGVSPLVGIRFRFNDRVGLQTSLNTELYQNNTTLTTSYDVLDSSSGAVLPVGQTSGTSTNGLDINIPINIVLTFRL